MKNKVKVTIFLFIAAALVVSVAAGYFLLAENVTEKRSDLSSDLRFDLANPENSETYQNPELGFSFDYPKDFAVSEFSDSGGEVILFSRGGAVIQIYITPYEGDEEVTAEKIRRDIPDLPMEKIGEHRVATSPAVSFISRKDSGEETREIWFYAGGNLFQISALASAEAVLREIAESWEFK